MNDLTQLSIWARFFLSTGRSVFGSKTPQETIDLGPDLERDQTGPKTPRFEQKNALTRTKNAPVGPQTLRLDTPKRPETSKKRPNPTQNAPTRRPYD